MLRKIKEEFIIRTFKKNGGKTTKQVSQFVSYDASQAHDDGKVSFCTEKQLLIEGAREITLNSDNSENILANSRGALLGMSYARGMMPISVQQYGFTLALNEPIWWLVIKEQILSLAACLGGSAVVKPMGKKDFADSSIFLDHATRKMSITNPSINKTELPTLKMPLKGAMSILDSLGCKREEELLFESSCGMAILIHGNKNPFLFKKMERIFGNDIVLALFVEPQPGKTAAEQFEELMYSEIDEELLPILKAVNNLIL